MSDRRDVIYVYDGTFDGLLSAVFESYASRRLPAAIVENEHVQENFLYAYQTILTDTAKARRVSAAVENKISAQALQTLYYAFLSNVPEKGRLCLDYIRAGFRLGRELDLHLRLDCVSKLQNAALQVKNETHQYLGFVRFAELEGGVFYSGIQPKNHVLPLLSAHFVRRLPQNPWMIHDTNRRLCLVYNGRSCYIAPTDTIPKLRYSDGEGQYRRLWKLFYDTVEIQARHNERCRMSHMPKRFWNNLPELNQPAD